MIDLDNFSILRKLSIMVIIGLVLILVVGFFGISGTQKISDQLSELYQNKYSHSITALEAYFDMQNYAVAAYLFVDETNRSKRIDIIQTRMYPHITLFNEKLAKYESIEMTEEETALFNDIKQVSAEYFNASKLGLELRLDGRDEEGEKLREEVTLPLRLEMYDGVQKLIELNNQSAFQYFEDSRTLSENTIKVILFCIIVCTIILLLISGLIIQNLSRRFNQIQKGLSEVREGNLAYRINMTGNDEISNIASSFDVMTSDLEIQTNIIQKNLEKAESANLAKSVFLANMSHELRTPLNAVLGFSRLMKSDPDITIKQRENLEIITHSGEHLLHLINDVLEISKIEAGRVELEESPLDLYQVIQEMQSLMYVRSEEKGLHFTIEYSSDLPHHVIADGGKLRQILINLIGNAIKFTETGSVVLRAQKVRTEDKGEVWVRFEVEDSGHGIRDEDRERIFLPFEQGDLLTHPEAGSGLGLSISRQYVELMGGKLQVESEPDKGSKFFFEIPVKIQKSESIPQESRYSHITGVVKDQPVYRILIAEDQKENRLLLHNLLKPLGFELKEAVNGKEAVELFESWHPDLIMMDIRMPVMDGLDASRRIKASEEGSNTKIIAITAHALEDERREILAAGIDAFIRKPFTETEIYEALARFLQVEFQYETEYLAAVETEISLNRAELKTLPPHLLAELYEAVVLLNSRRCLEVITRIGDINPKIGNDLRSLVEQMQYETLLEILDNLEDDGPDKQ